MKLYKRNGSFYRVLDGTELVRSDDLVAWASQMQRDKKWCRAGPISCAGYSARTHKSFAFLREVDPLIGAMVSVHDRVKEKR